MDPEAATRLDVAQLHGPIGDDGIPAADLDAVRRLARAYAFGIDRRDEALVQSLFTDDAVVAGSLGMSTASEYVPKLIAGASEYAATQHNITNQYVAPRDRRSRRSGRAQLRGRAALRCRRQRPRHGRRVPRPRPPHRPGWLISHRNTVVLWRRPT